MRALVNSRKHIVQTTLNTVGNAAAFPIVLVEAKQGADESAAPEVSPGAVVKAVYLEYWLLAAMQQPSTMTMIVEKIENGAASATAGFMGQLHTYPNKKNILETHQGIIGDANSNPVPVFRGWIKIPKGKQRFGLGDRLVVSTRSITEDTTICGLAIFKSYS